MYGIGIPGGGMLAIGGNKGTAEVDPKLNVGGAFGKVGSGAVAYGGVSGNDAAFEVGYVGTSGNDATFEAGYVGASGNDATFEAGPGACSQACSFMLADIASGLARLGSAP